MPKVSYAERQRRADQSRRQRLLNEFEVADRLGVWVDMLRAARGGRGELACLAYVKLPGRLVRYEQEDVEALINDGRTCAATAAE